MVFIGVEGVNTLKIVEVGEAVINFYGMLIDELTLVLIAAV